MRSNGVNKFLHRCKRGLAFALATVMLIGQGVILNSESVWAAPGDALKDKYVGFVGKKVEWKYGGAEDLNYREYSEKYADIANADKEISIPLTSIKGEQGAYKTVNFEGKECILSDKASEKMEFSVNIPNDGKYQIEIEYYLSTKNSDSGKRTIYIDNVAPFEESSDIVFDRFFKDAGEPVINSIGDETRPKQVTIPGWRTTRLADTSGKYDDSFAFALTAGKHTINIVYMTTDMYIASVKLVCPREFKTYKEVLASYEAAGYKDFTGETLHYEAELTAIEKNDSTLRRENDGDPLVYPVSDVTRKLNVIGAYRWRTGNQTITWEFEVPESGLYNISMYVKQQWNDGLPSYRQISIDGEVPFKELLMYKIPYDTSWNVDTLHDKDGENFKFYLEAGKHTMMMSVKLGEMGEILDSVRDDIELLSDLLLDITMIAGANPDPNYDFRFFSQSPSIKTNMEAIVDSLEEKYERAKSLSEKMPAMANNFLTIRAQLKSMLDDPFSIAKRFGSLTEAQTSLSEWYTSLQSSPAVIDCFYFSSPEQKVKNYKSNIFQQFGVNCKQFAVSFTKDYDNVGGVLADGVVVKDTIKVWIARGTEWAEVIKEMSDEDFTPTSGIAIDVNVVPGSQLSAGNVNALMLSITSNKAPDVALGVDSTSPVEFAIRDQVVDLSQFSDFEEVKERFIKEIFTPYEYMGGTFAIPETMNFNVLFYRKDILSQFGIDLPETRQDLYDYVLPALYQEGLKFYFGREFTEFLFQLGGDYYTDDFMLSALDTPEAYLAFKEYTEMFTNYGVDKTVSSFYQNFRSGTMPLGVGDFNLYMTLQVAAPEIAGKWGIYLLPGTKKEDGTIDRTTGGFAANCDIIMAQTKKKDAAWEFLKWWSSDETQTRFAKEVEALMGQEARWNTANKSAFLSLSWDQEDIEVIEEMWGWAKETPVVLGSYMTARHLTNAWTTVVISGGDVREALEQAVKAINREMRMKQEEYGVISNE